MATRTTRRSGEDEQVETKIEVYAADLLKWPLEVALMALDRWPQRSQWWPTWFELQGLLSEFQANYLHALPKPDHDGDGPIPADVMCARTTRPFPNRLSWTQLLDAMKFAEERGRHAWLRQARTIYDAQLPYARARGWS